MRLSTAPHGAVDFLACRHDLADRRRAHRGRQDAHQGDDEVPLPAGFVAGVATIIFSRSVRSAPVFSSSKYLRTIYEMLSILTVALGMGFIRVNLRPPLQASPTK